MTGPPSSQHAEPASRACSSRGRSGRSVPRLLSLLYIYTYMCVCTYRSTPPAAQLSRIRISTTIATAQGSLPQARANRSPSRAHVRTASIRISGIPMSGHQDSLVRDKLAPLPPAHLTSAAPREGFETAPAPARLGSRGPAAAAAGIASTRSPPTPALLQLLRPDPACAALTPLDPRRARVPAEPEPSRYPATVPFQPPSPVRRSVRASRLPSARARAWAANLELHTCTEGKGVGARAPSRAAGPCSGAYVRAPPLLPLHPTAPAVACACGISCCRSQPASRPTSDIRNPKSGCRCPSHPCWRPGDAGTQNARTRAPRCRRVSAGVPFAAARRDGVIFGWPAGTPPRVLAHRPR